MKKSSIIVKILLALVIFTLAFALVACDKGDNKDDNGGDKKPTVDDPTDDGPTLSQNLVEVVGVVDGLLGRVKTIERNSKIYADLGVGLDLNIPGANIDGDGKLSIKGNINNENPEALINLEILDKDWFTVGYINKTAYLAQPLTAINTGNETWGNIDKVSFNATAIAPAIASAVDVVMIYLDDLVKNSLADFSLEDISSLISGLGGMVDGLGAYVNIVKGSDGGYTLTTTPGLIDMVLPMVTQAVPAVSGIFDSLKLNELLAENGLFLSVKIGVDSNKILNSLELGIEISKYTEESDDTTGETKIVKTGDPIADIKLAVDLRLTVGSNGTISAGSGYNAKALNLNLNAALPQKGDSKANLDLYVDSDLFAQNSALAAYAKLTLNDNNSYGYAAGNAAYFDTTAIKGIGYETNQKYSAKLPEMKVGETVYTTVAEFCNANAAKWVKETEETIKNKKPAASEGEAGGSESGSGSTENTGSDKGLIDQLQQMIGELIGIKNDDDITEADICSYLNTKIGKYVNFTIENTYVKTVDNIVELVAANDTWLLGADFFKTKAEGRTITTFGDFIKEGNLLKDGAKVTAGEDGNMDCGIVEWNTKTWSGGLSVTAAGDNNDLLDAVNLFAKNGKDGKFVLDSEGAGANDTNMVDLLNFYIAAFGKFLPDGFVFTAEQKAAIKTADAMTDETAKKTELDKYLTTENANKVLSGLLGITSLDSIKNNLFIKLGCVENKGLNGSISIVESSAANAKVYASLSLGIMFVAKDETTHTTVLGEVNTFKTAVEAAQDVIDLTDATDNYAKANALLAQMNGSESSWLKSFWDYTGAAA